MVQGPIDYTTDVKDPFMQGLQGYQIAQNMAMQRDQRTAQQQAMAQQQAAAQAKAQQAQQYKLDLADFSQKTNKTATDYENFLMKYPQQREAIKESYGMQSEEKSMREMAKAQQIQYAIAAGKYEIAKQIMTQQMEEAQAQGDGLKAESLKMMIENFDDNPQAVYDSIGLSQATILGKEKFGENLSKLDEAMRQRDLHPDAIKKLKAESGKLSAETAKIWNDIATMGDNEKQQRLADLEGDKRNIVKSLWSNIDTQLKEFRTADAANKRLGNISKAAEKGSPAAQLAMIFNFMKINDPGSVVRESEFKTAAQAKAFISKVDNGEIQVNASAMPGLQMLRQMAFGNWLTPVQVRDFKATADDLFAGQQQNADMILNDIVDRAKSEDISPERVLGTSRYQAWQKRRTDAPAKPAVKNLTPEQAARAEELKAKLRGR